MIDSKKFSYFNPYYLFLLLAFIVSCGEDTETEIEEIIDDVVLNIADYEASVTSITDQGNSGNPSDLQISFLPATNNDSISEYRIVIAKEGQNLETEEVVDLTPNQYTSVPGGFGTYNITLSESQVDLEDEAIQNAESYFVYLISIGTFKDSTVYALTSTSSFVFEVKSETSTLAANLGANDCISLDQNGNIYVSEYGDYNPNTFSGNGTSVVKVSPAGETSVFADGLVGPVGSTFDEDGNFYVVSGSNFSSGDLVKITSSGEKSTVATIAGYPSGVALGEDGHFYVANYWIGNISKVTASGEVSIFVEDDALKGCIGIVYDENGNLLTGNGDNGDLFSIDPSGNITKIATTAPASYITYFDGYIYSTSVSTNKIYRTALTGDSEVFAGDGSPTSIDGELEIASFNSPNGITIDPENRVLYVSQIDRTLRVIPID